MIAGASAMLASACATAQPQEREQPIPVRGETPGRTCDSSGIQDFVGRQRSPQVEAQLRESSGAARIRWVPKGAAVTMDYRSDRVTAFLDAAMRIERISCG
ncbi:MAG: hypothetical protein H0W39_10570 [Sphingomonas sp.]|nr:hypothetical protein [Sphingomonas sp.]